MYHNLKIIPCSINSLKDIREFVNSTLQVYCIPESDINMIVLAIDEICANRIIHSNHDKKNHILEINIKGETQGICFEIVDEGDVYDHNSHPEPSLQQLVKDRKKGGLGLTLVKKIMDSFTITKENDNTVCRLFKKIAFC